MPRTSFPARLARWGAAAVLAFAAAAAPAQAPANRLDQIVARGTLRVGTTGDYKPFSLRTAGDAFVGLDVALAADLAKAMGVKLQLVPTTWSTLMPDLEADRFDLAMGGISVTLERQRKAFFSIPTMRDGKTPIARCEDVARYATLADIDRKEVRVIVNPGGTNERFARARLSHATLVVHPDNVTIFDRIVAREADVMVTDAVETRLQARLHPGRLCAIHPDAPFDFSEKAVLLPRDVVLKAFVDQWLHQAIESGQYARMDEQWLAYPWGVETLRRLIDERLMLAPDVARYKWNHQLPIEDLPREKALVEKLGAEADALGVPRAAAEAFFRAQIQASKTLQGELFRGWEARKPERFTQEVDLATVTRPRIDRVTEQLMRALAEDWPVLSDPSRREDVARALRPMQAEALSAQAVGEALAPLAK